MYKFIEISRPEDDCRCLARITEVNRLEELQEKHPELKVRLVVSSVKEKIFNYDNY